MPTTASTNLQHHLPLHQHTVVVFLSKNLPKKKDCVSLEPTIQKARKVTHMQLCFCTILNIQQKNVKHSIFLRRTEDQAFVLVFVMKKTEFLNAKHWLRQLPVMQKLRKTVLKKRVTGKENSNFHNFFLDVQNYTEAFLPQRNLYTKTNRPKK